MSRRGDENLSYIEDARFEQLFWMQVFGDHARFFIDTLAAKEEEDVKKALYFKKEYDKWYEASKRLTESNVQEQLKETKNLTDQLRAFKLSIIRRQLEGKISINLPPTFINHMVNELEEYLNVHQYLEKGESPPIFHELHHHLVWLLDAAGHAQGINDSLDMVEHKIKMKSFDFVNDFKEFYVKAVELAGYLRANVESFPALNRMNKEVKLEIELFMVFLDEIKELQLTDQLLGTFSVIMADHMAREECYYLMKLAQSTATHKPDCDPTQPRIEG
ncbi:DUF2935 domain-containing protein [Sutcliffiella halmapala]|uniref:DUF2935 domain-containing protein n=1 Tax=Sutcliffiella halmapala TaxID=79882 RepID=UPI000994C236|nr:DUF2935 domain-containing protein [Sutcliffiella halmapala]